MGPTREERLELAEQFLQEAVYRSRGAQAGAGLFASGDPDRGDCGLGERAAVVLDLSPRAEEVFGLLWPEGLTEAELDEIREKMTSWIELQDALDRKRNHFLKAFRNEHGFERSSFCGASAPCGRFRCFGEPGAVGTVLQAPFRSFSCPVTLRAKHS